MFEIGKKYWFRINGTKREVNIKGKVVEENAFMVKIERDDGDKEIIMFNQLIHSNEVRENSEIKHSVVETEIKKEE